MINFCQDPVLFSVLDKKGYKYVCPIGRGGCATCFLIKSIKYNIDFVCKKIELEKMTSCQQCELEALKQLNSPDVIRLYDFEYQPGSIFLFLEFCSMGSIQDHIDKNGPIPHSKLVGLMKCILESLQYIHKNRYAHLDIKPSNILIDRYGRPKMADFGISRQFLGNLPKTQKKAGTLQYKAPEFFSQGSFDPYKADIYALGITFFVLATGETPWDEMVNTDFKKTIQSGQIKYPMNIDPFVKDVIKQMVNLCPEERPLTPQLLSLPGFVGVQKKDGYFDSKFLTSHKQKASRPPMLSGNPISMMSKHSSIIMTGKTISNRLSSSNIDEFKTPTFS